jgi:hypothetical protein
VRSTPTVSLPKDAELVELRSDLLSFRTRECVLPGTVVRFSLVMEGQRLPLEAMAQACLVVEKRRGGYVFDCQLSLVSLPEPDRHIITLFIEKGRGSPGLLPNPAPR